MHDDTRVMLDKGGFIIMRLLIIEGNGIAGHMLLQYFALKTSYELFYTTSGLQKAGRKNGELYLDTMDPLAVEKLMQSLRPDLVINCAGIINDSARLRELEAYRINGLLPHQLAGLAEQYGGRLLQISSDSVFSGNRGAYEERHVPNGTSVYAKTKALGEVLKKPHITIRTSLIGPEADKPGIGLLEWFMQQRGRVKGFVNVLWNGVTTLELAKFIHYLLEQKKGISGIVHLTSAEIISKYELLCKFQQILGQPDAVILPDDAIVLDRTLKNTRTDLENYPLSDYTQMLTELRDWMKMTG
jgi:dTDP-4-dehydrorhamnose reductase